MTFFQLWNKQISGKMKKNQHFKFIDHMNCALYFKTSKVIWQERDWNLSNSLEIFPAAAVFIYDDDDAFI